MNITMNVQDQEWVKNNDHDLWLLLNGVSEDVVGPSDVTADRYYLLSVQHSLADILSGEARAIEQMIDRNKVERAAKHWWSV